MIKIHRKTRYLDLEEGLNQGRLGPKMTGIFKYNMNLGKAPTADTTTENTGVILPHLLSTRSCETPICSPKIQKPGSQCLTGSISVICPLLQSHDLTLPLWKAEPGPKVWRKVWTYVPQGHPPTADIPAKNKALTIQSSQNKRYMSITPHLAVFSKTKTKHTSQQVSA